MVGFVLKNTLSDNGGVTRGVCIESNGYLDSIVETKNIEKVNGKAMTGTKELDLDSVVSMNMWGLQKGFITDVLETGFTSYLGTVEDVNSKSEYLLPTIIGNLLEEKKCSVKVLKSNDEWFGVTYKEDKEAVKQSIQALVDQGVYPSKL